MKALLLSLLIASPAAAQVSPPVRPAGPLPSTVTVSGDAVVYAPPDRARLRFGVETEGPSPEATLTQHEEEVAAVLAAVRRLGVPDRQIQLEWVGLHQHHERSGRHVANRFVVVTTDSLRLVPELVATVVDAGADHLAGLEYFLLDDDRFEDQALGAAFERARDKAERLAAAAGVRLGPVALVHEQGVQPPAPVPVMYARAEMDVSANPGAYSTGQSEVRAVVVVSFYLETP